MSQKGASQEKEVANLTIPFQIKIPLTIVGSSCRKTVGGCRYWDGAKEQWSTEGMTEAGAYTHPPFSST